MFMHGSATRIIFAGAALGALSLGGCSDETRPLAPEAASFAHGTPQQPAAEFNRELAALRRLTAPFHNIEKARDAGYDVEITPCWYHSGLGAAQGYHYGNPQLINGTVSLLEPELLMYEPNPAGHLQLVGLEYIVPIHLWEGASPPKVLGQEFHVNAALGLYVLHVWLWRHNPAGIFDDWNANVSCRHAAVSEDRS